VVGIVSIVTKVSMGNLADRTGNTVIFLIVSIITGLSFLWLRVSNELWMLYLFAVAMGFNYGSFSALNSPLVADFFGLKAHGTIFGLTMFALGIGGAIGPLVAGSIFDNTGSYDWAFVLCAILGGVNLVLAIFLRAARKQKTAAKAWGCGMER
jgi:MFS family permease